MGPSTAVVVAINIAMQHGYCCRFLTKGRERTCDTGFIMLASAQILVQKDATSTRTVRRSIGNIVVKSGFSQP